MVSFQIQTPGAERLNRLLTNASDSSREISISHFNLGADVTSIELRSDSDTPEVLPTAIENIPYSDLHAVCQEQERLGNPLNPGIITAIEEMNEKRRMVNQTSGDFTYGCENPPKATAS